MSLMRIPSNRIRLSNLRLLNSLGDQSGPNNLRHLSNQSSLKDLCSQSPSPMCVNANMKVSHLAGFRS